MNTNTELRTAVRNYLKYTDTNINVTLTGQELETIQMLVINEMSKIWKKNPEKELQSMHILLNKISKATEPVKEELGANELTNL